ncbi:hypothetical protein AO370_0359 [Moraxella catarrhalis]|uniref:Uncharacterized protein n=1 Tax=Moraxella catarrhalis TaxID=480 RepID=A0AB36DQG5_MORCA|nr:hypothetical protein AO370_0359 [Moraxella catarrhalis]
MIRDAFKAIIQRQLVITLALAAMVATAATKIERLVSIVGAKNI